MSAGGVEEALDSMLRWSEGRAMGYSYCRLCGGEWYRAGGEAPRHSKHGCPVPDAAATLAARDDVGATPEGGTPASQGEHVTVEVDSGGWWVIYLDGKPFSKCVDRDYAGQCAERLRVALQRAPRPEERT
jgi:hypothetical protein